MRRIVSGIALGSMVFIAALLWPMSDTSVRDFTSFWIAGQQLIHHHNPYDRDHALAVERPMGLTNPRPLVMRNPPWALWLTLPVALMSYSRARLLWTMVLIVAIFCAAAQLWIMNIASLKRLWIPGLLAFAFAPTLACLSNGQTGPFVLLGLTLFLWLEARHQFWAGSALLLAAIKPQIAFLFWVALLLWSIQRRKWVLLGGLASSLVVASGLAALFDAHVITNYFAMLRAESIEIQFLPTFAGFLRQEYGRAWLQILPGIIGVFATIIYYFRHHLVWEWSQELSALLFASLLLTPYAWLGDEVIILCGLIAAAAMTTNTRGALYLAIPFLAVNGVVLAMLARGVRVSSPYYIWTIWAWTAFYIAATRLSGRERHVKIANAINRQF